MIMKTLEQPRLTGPGLCRANPSSRASSRFIGIDAGGETLKLAALLSDEAGLRIGRCEILEHGRKPGPMLLDALRRWDWAGTSGAAVGGRFAGQIRLPRIPAKQAQLRGARFLLGDRPVTIVNIGSHGFSVLEARAHGPARFRENNRCSQ